MIASHPAAPHPPGECSQTKGGRGLGMRGTDGHHDGVGRVSANGSTLGGPSTQAISSVHEVTLCNGPMSAPLPKSGRLWRLGSTTSPSLSDHLRLASRTTANEALRNLGNPSPAAAVWAATAAGVAVETALKLCLATANPAFIALNVDSGIRLEERTDDPIESVRTLSGQDAARAVRLLYPNHPPGLNGRQVDLVLAFRNTAAHIGYVHPDRVSEAMQAMVVVVQACLKLLNDDPETFWNEENVPLMEHLEAEEIERSRFELELQKAEAHRRYAQRLRDIPTAQIEQVRAVLAAGALRIISPPEVVVHTCPVCESSGALVRYITDSDTDFTGSQYPDDHPAGERFAYPDLFDCSVCGLSLTDSEMELDDHFDDVLEEEVEPSEEFWRALHDWKYEQEQEQALERSMVYDYDDPDR